MAGIEDQIQLGPMKQLAEVIRKDDDWSGLADSVARRKRQNRLNQRAYRKRKALQAQNQRHQPHDVTLSWEYLPTPPIHGSATQFSYSNVIPAHPNPPASTPVIPYFDPSQTSRWEGPIHFPLSPDHLIVLVQYNVLRATLTNMAIMSLLSTMPMECGNALSIPLLPAPTTIPPNLIATPLQESTPHDPWIDILPLGAMRDNMILFRGDYDHNELCDDIVGGLFEGFNDLEMRGILVWSDPWHPSGWEVTEGFLRKWGWLLKGCGELIESTNRWRVLRNEEPLVVEV